MRRLPAFLLAASAKAWMLVVFCIGALAALPTSAESPVSPEYKLKAAYLFNFAKFVQWPTHAFPDATSPILIGVLGDDPFGDSLDQIVRGRNINDRPLVVKRSGNVEDLTSCHVLFISASEDDRKKQILTTLQESHALTVNEGAEFLRQGGMIRFTMEAQRVRFEINTRPAERAKLKVSSELLDLATAVRSYNDGENR